MIRRYTYTQEKIVFIDFSGPRDKKCVSKFKTTFLNPKCQQNSIKHLIVEIFQIEGQNARSHTWIVFAWIDSDQSVRFVEQLLFQADHNQLDIVTRTIDDVFDNLKK